MENQSSQQAKQIIDFVEKEFDANVLPGLQTFISIPNVSRAFDPEWDTNGLLQKAANFLVEWAKKQDLKGAKIELLNESSKTPMIFVEVDGTTPDAETVLFYGHLDKQPHMVGWREGLGPTTPVIEDGKLYGRGAADDGYSIFAAILVIKTCQALGLPHPRCVITIEADEETDSRDLPYYFDLLADRIRTPSTIICLDAGCGNYEQLWATNTLRGVLECNLTIKIITEGVHSGDASGIVADTVRIARILLDRLEDQATGNMHKSFYVDIPEERHKQAEAIAKLLGPSMMRNYPFVPTAQTVNPDPFVCYLNRIWRPTLTVTGVDSIPKVHIAGNVLRPETTFKLSIRLPPTLRDTDAVAKLKEILLKDPPYGAEVTLDNISMGNGWNAPTAKPYFDEVAQQASLNFFGKNALYFGSGGSIPFMDVLSDKFPKCQFFVTGILGPNSNAHGPNEFLHIAFTKKLICCLVQMLNACYEGAKKSQ